jgi:hypothetical protein
MKTTLTPGTYVVVGDEYAKRLGYEELVGQMGVVDSVLSALCGVTIMSGDATTFGKQLDIHIHDCIPSKAEEEEERPYYSVIIDLYTGHIYYSTNRELVQYTKKCLWHRHDVREVSNIRELDEVHTFCEKELGHILSKQQKSNPDFTWLMFCLDDRESEETRGYLETFEAEKACEQTEQEAFQESRSKKEVVDLTAQLREQMQQKIAKATPYEFRELNPGSLSTDFTQHSDEYTSAEWDHEGDVYDPGEDEDDDDYETC